MELREKQDEFHYINNKPELKEGKADGKKGTYHMLCFISAE